MCLAAALICFTGCGYVGPVLPPSPEIPAQVTDLVAIERGDKIEIAFRTPPRTTDNLPIKRFADIDLKIGPALAPFDFETWEKTATTYPLPPPGEVDPSDPHPIAVSASLPLAGLLGKHVAIAVRTSVKHGEHYSGWSNRVVLDVNPPLGTPAEVKAESAAEGVVVTWQAVDRAKSYRLLRQGPADKNPLEIGASDKARFVDATTQYDLPYSYAVVAIAESSESAESAQAKITPEDRFPPSIPAGVNALAGPDSIEISWQRSPESDLAGYYIYRSTEDGPFERQGDMLTLPAYSDRKVEHGKSYRYAITSIDRKKNESPRSDFARAAF